MQFYSKSKSVQNCLLYVINDKQRGYWQRMNRESVRHVPAVRPFCSSCLTALHRWGGNWDVMNWNTTHTHTRTVKDVICGTVKKKN